MFGTLVRRMAQASKPQFTATPSPYKLKKVWPPDFSKMSKHEELRFEKRYKRRLQHIATRPRWNKFIKLAQLFTITFVVAYSVLFMDWKDERQPFDDVRQKFWELFGLTYEPKHIKTKDARVEPTATKS